MDVARLAALAKLRLEDGGLDKYTKDLNLIAQRLTDGLPNIESKPIPPLMENKMVLRKDEIEPSLKREILLSNACAVESGCVVVPKLLEQ